ncbi:ABC transporter permease subunit [Phycisphaeraceae bacterium D3-23]
MSDRLAEIQKLRRAAPRDWVVRGSIAVLVLAVVWVWLFSSVALVGIEAGAVTGDPGWSLSVPSDQISRTFSPQRAENLQRFVGKLSPRVKPEDGTVLGWLWRLLSEKGLSAMATTLAVAVSAIVLAALFALPVLWLGSRNLARADALVAGGRRPGALTRWRWRSQVAGVRGLFVFLRALPEYVLAFVLVVLGPGAWPAVLALAIHNFGILGRLGSEVVENTDPAAARNARAAGATRTQIATLVLFPQTLSRMLLYFFYRWESCVRESVVLGMLGVATLGYYIQNDARARMRYDEMLLYLMLGAALVLAGDLVSALVRRWVRNA